uniref:Uncharacterized protein n=1 Tax=Arundo donax TaxID=35708 RepID=A0A0A9FV85_ARUDO
MNTDRTDSDDVLSYWHIKCELPQSVHSFISFYPLDNTEKISQAIPNKIYD